MKINEVKILSLFFNGFISKNLYNLSKNDKFIDRINCS